MTLRDSLGFALTGATPDALAHYEAATRQLLCFVGDPVAEIDRAIEAAPAFVMAHVFKGFLYGLSTDAPAMPVVREIVATATALPGDAREGGHVAALAALAGGHWHRAGQLLEDLSVAAPRDIAAMMSGHQIDFFTGNARMLRDRIARALPAWDAAMPGYHAMLGMHAFGLEECGDYGRAEKRGRRAVELEPRDGWAHHAVAHVLEMQARQRDGISWMREESRQWSAESFLQVHNWWHLALYHYELGETDAVLALYDGPIRSAGGTLAINMLDASALLWRLHLGGVDTGGRWASLAADWAPRASDGNYAFNDMHAMMAFVAAGRDEPARLLLERQREAMTEDEDNAGFTRDVGHPVALALAAFGHGDYAETVRLLRPVRGIAHRFGGSHAQRDVIDLTLIEAALRSDDRALARALTAERADARPASPLSALFQKRAAAGTA